MVRQWKLQKPDIVISVHGGLKNFKLDPHHKEIFNRGLIKAAKTTHSGAWIITGKINSLLNLLYHTYFIIFGLELFKTFSLLIMSLNGYFLIDMVLFRCISD